MSFRWLWCFRKMKAFFNRLQLPRVPRLKGQNSFPLTVPARVRASGNDDGRSAGQHAREPGATGSSLCFVSSSSCGVPEKHRSWIKLFRKSFGTVFLRRSSHSQSAHNSRNPNPGRRFDTHHPSRRGDFHAIQTHCLGSRRRVVSCHHSHCVGPKRAAIRTFSCQVPRQTPPDEV
jgi:hypothetical protein